MPELASLYSQRWEFDSALDELKVHQRGPRVVLRSKTPDGVIHEVYGHLCVHYAIRWLMHTVALQQGHDPDRISVTRTLRAARRTAASHAGFPPEALTSALAQTTDELLFDLLPPRRSQNKQVPPQAPPAPQPTQAHPPTRRDQHHRRLSQW